MFISVLLLITILSQASLGNKVRKCKAVNYIGNVTADSQAFFLYHFNLNVSFNPHDTAIYRNKIVFQNFMWETLDDSDYQIFFPIPVYLGIDQNIIYCDIQDSSCEIFFPNGIMHFYINIQNGSDSSNIQIPDVISLFFEDGYIFDGSDGSLLTDENKCRNGVYSNNDLTFYQQACCLDFEDVVTDEPDIYHTCTEFQTNAFITDVANGFSINLAVEYHVASISTNEKEMYMHLTILNSTLPSSTVYNHYMFGVNSELNQCQGSINDLISSYCNLTKIMSNDIKQFDMVFTFEYATNGGGLIIYPEVIIGHLLTINGTFYKTLNSSFTSENSCWVVESAGIAFLPFSSTNYVASFCCTKFENLTLLGTSTSTPINFENASTASTMPNLSTTTFTDTTTTNNAPFIKTLCLKLWFLLICTFYL